MCNEILCTDCAVQDVMDCKCCKQVMQPHNQPILCISCVVTHWFSPDGFTCDICTERCSNSTSCNVKGILDNQTECPICLEAFGGSSYDVQHCDLHKVCTACGYNKNKGCPICRVGK
jgi:hypothetical protein